MLRHPWLVLSLTLLLCASIVPDAVGDDRVGRGGGIVILPHAIRLADCGAAMRESHRLPNDGSAILARLPAELHGGVMVAVAAGAKEPVPVSASVVGGCVVLAHQELSRLEDAGVSEVRLTIVGATGNAIELRVPLAGRSDRSVFDLQVW